MSNSTIENEVIFDKIANFKPNWNSIEKTTNWITSIVEFNKSIANNDY